MDAIFTRRSVRRFTAQSVSEESITKVLAAAMAAPSAGNEQPWHFIVVKEKAALKKVSECSPYARAAQDAPVCIVVCGDLSLDKYKGAYWVQDCSAAVENMLLEVQNLGLGAVWLGVYPEEERVGFLKRYFSLPEHVIPFAAIPIGFPAQTLPPADRYDPKRVHQEKWGRPSSL